MANDCYLAGLGVEGANRPPSSLNEVHSNRKDDGMHIAPSKSDLQK